MERLVNNRYYKDGLEIIKESIKESIGIVLFWISGVAVGFIVAVFFRRISDE
jgi:hypothetical protein